MGSKIKSTETFSGGGVPIDDYRTWPLNPLPQRKLQKRKTADFRLKSHFAWKKSLLQSFYVWKLSAAKL